jgi:predicted metal-binding membrane protein
MAKRVPHPAHTADNERYEHKDLLDTPDVVETEEIDTSEEMAAPPPVASAAERRQLQIRRVRSAIYFVAHIIAILFGIRIALGLFGANPENAFFVFLQTITLPFAAPFINLFGMFGESSSGFASALGLLFGIAIYYLFAWIAAGIATSVMSRPIKTVHEARSE